MSEPVTTSEAFINREWSWLEFNRRVLEEAQDSTNPLLERLKFACIFCSNLDEFFMVRVAGLKSQMALNPGKPDPAGLTPRQQLDGIAERAHALVATAYGLVVGELMPALADEGIRVLSFGELDSQQVDHCRRLYAQQILPTLTPLAIRPGARFPIVSNLSLNLAVLLAREPADRTLAGRPGVDAPAADDAQHAGLDRLAIVQVPGNLPRLVSLPAHEGHAFILLEEIVRHHLEGLFRGQAVLAVAAFRITRDAELEFDDEGGETTFLQVVEEELNKRRTNQPVRLEMEACAEPALGHQLRQRIGVGTDDVYAVGGPVDLRSLTALVDVPAYATLRDQPRKPLMPPRVVETDDVFETVRAGDLLLHHPYDSFDPVVRLIAQAADDPDVLAIKMTLYRTSSDSPIIAALARAAEAGKQVTVLVELMARFDEGQNIGWARQLEVAGAHVIYGLAGYKTHAKCAMVVRQEPDGIRRYLHLGTGNYNDKTARLYTDMGLLTCDEELGLDATGFFNTITGYSDPPSYSKLVMAPLGMRERLVALIEREADRARAGQPAAVLAKMNSLVDVKIIEALCDASRAGVPVRLNVRGVCCLRPGIEGASDTITVTSIVDRYLEHSRVFYFRNGGDEEVYMSSADWMNRNLDKRVELLFPVEDPACKHRAIEILETFFRDNVRARRLQPDGSYVRVERGDAEPLRCQHVLYEQARRAHQRRDAAVRIQFRPQMKQEP